MAPCAAASSAPTSTSQQSLRINRVDIPTPLVLSERGQLLQLFVHPEVPMRNHFISQVDPRCLVDLPMKATHILLDLLPPHPRSSMVPTIEQRGFIDHRGHRKVLCGYWAQECLRIEGVADTGFWDLAGWDDTDQDDPIAIDHVVVVSDDEGEDEDGSYGPPGSQARRVRGSERILKRQRMGTRTTPASARHTAASDGTNAPRDIRDVLPGSRGGGRGRGRGRGQARARGRGAGPSGASQRASAGSSRINVAAEEIDDLESEDEGLIAPLTPTSNTPPSQSIGTSGPGPSHRPTALQSATRPGSPSRTKGPRTRKRRKGLKELSPAEIQEQYDYFLSFTQQQLGQRVPENSRVGSVHTVKQWMILNVQDMWVEARTKYCRRNLDTMCIMLSSWKTARDYNLSPQALRKHYDSTKRVIIADKGAYVPVGQRPPNWPFHDRAPKNPEAGVHWIYDWTSKECNAFLGRDTSTGAWGLGMLKDEEDSEVEEDQLEEDQLEDKVDVEDLTGLISD